MAIDLIKKSNRTLLGKRYTTDAFTDGQDAFTSVFDINSTEIFTQTSLVPTASLPFSGSSQNGYYYTTTGTKSATATGADVMRYWYRHALTKSDLATPSGQQVWMFISGSSSISTGAQLIDDNQQTSFISPKYSSAAISTNNTESSTPGYVIKAVYSNNNLSTTTDIDSSYYNFDYKTGLLQFTSSAIAQTVIADVTNGRVYLSAYQYVGETLFTKLSTLSSGGNSTSPWLVSGTILYTSQSYNIQTTGSLTINGDVSNVFIVKSINDTQELLKVMSSGITQFYVNVSNPSDPAGYGQLYFTSSSLFIGID